MCPRDSDNDFKSHAGERLREITAPAADLLLFDYDENLIFDREALGMWLHRSADVLEWQCPTAPQR